MRRVFVAAVLIAALAAAEASAAVKPHTFFLSPMAGGYFFDSDEQLKDSPAYTLGIGYHFSRHWSGEVVSGFIDTRTTGSERNEIDGYPLRLDLLYSFRPEERLVPHLAAGFGGLWLDDPGKDTDVDAVFGYGLGMRYFLVDSVALRADVRQLHILENLHFDGSGSSRHFMANAGVSFQFGGDREPPPQIDSDGDGVIDAFDRCPGTKLGVPVDAFGCPADEDGDGVPDFLDRCPQTPPGVKTDRHGCPVETPSAPAPAIPSEPSPAAPPGTSPVPPPASAAKAEPIPAIVQAIELRLAFRTGEAEIRPEFAPELARAAEFLRLHEGKRLVIEGHTDSIGPEEANQELSLRRAESVRRHLLQQTGISPERVSVRGYGETRPVGDNATPEGRLKNRRVVIRVDE